MSENLSIGPDYRVLFEQLPGLYMVLSPKLIIVTASDAYLQATMTRREDIIGRFFFDVFPDNPEDTSADGVRNSLASFNRVLQTKQSDAMVVQRHDVRKSKSEGGGFEVRYWSPINSPILNADGSLAYILHRVENVTEYVLMKQQGIDQEKLTDALREQTTHMEADLYERSREAAEGSLKLKEANQELGRLYEKARELGELKNRFFANISHELRTPLALIIGPVEDLLDRKDLDEEARHELMVVKRYATLLNRHVNDLLDIAKLEAGSSHLEYTRTDLAKLARQVVSYFELLAADRHVDYVAHTPSVLVAEVDAEKVERMLLNLLSNAFKFTPLGGNIEVSLEERCGRALISVQDNGPGVREDQREAIFDRFRQGDGITEHQRDGVGLGLAIVREFAELQLGTVSVTESPIGGALFVLDLPLTAPPGTLVLAQASSSDTKTADKAGYESQERHTSSKPVVSAPNARAHLLVVEDNPDMNAFLEGTLSRHHQITCAFTGQEGLRKALANPPDLIIADVMLPGMCGDKMVEEIRKHDILDEVPIIILTAKIDHELRIKMLRSGVQDFIEKPFSVAELLARVDSLLADRRRTGRLLRQGEERLKRFYESGLIGVIYWNMDGQILDANDKFLEMVGYSREELTAGKLNWIAMTPPECRYLDEKSAEELKTNGVNKAPFEKEFTRKDLTRVPVIVASAMLDEARFDGVAFVLDITDRKRAEEDLRFQEELFHTFIEHTPAAVAMFDRNMRYLAYSRQWLKDYGLGDRNLIGLNHYEVFPEISDEWKEIHQRCLAGATERREEDTFPRIDGTVDWVKWEIVPWREADNSIGGIIAFTEVITKRKKAEEALRAEQEHKLEFYRRTLSAATGGKLIITEADAIERLARPAQATWEINGPDDIRIVRHAVKAIAEAAGMDDLRLGQLLVCVGEAGTNIVKHAGRGRVSLQQTEDAILVVLSDKGHGIPALALPAVALTKGYSTTGTLGMGYKLMIEFADRIYLATGTEGTTVGIEISLHDAELPSYAELIQDVEF